MSNVGIVGAGVAGLHLALFLRKHGVDVTVYEERTADQIARSAMFNSVAHHHHTRERERALGVNFWDDSGVAYGTHHHCISGGVDVRFRGDFRDQSLAVDHRIYLPRLMEELEQRGGKLVIRALTSGAVDRLSTQHDLMVVATGRVGLADMFPPIPELSPSDRPLRLLCAAMFDAAAMSWASPLGVTLGISPGHGEMIVLPILSFGGLVAGMLFEAIPGGDLVPLTQTRPDAGVARFERLVLDTIERHFPAVFERLSPKDFHLTRPLDVLQGAVIPRVRRPSAVLSSGVLAVAVGDARVTVDPMTGQGANLASYSAWALGEMIVGEGPPFDQAFCERWTERTNDFVLGAYEWTNLMLTMPPHVLGVLGAMARNKALADDFTQNFNRPDLQRAHLATPERAAAYLKGYAGGEAQSS
jgi:2-polyprenyl-6-methoxyphenol hydroxylase-like FAD-dependent oxidoreductase